jgi:hypothetical protein
MEYTGKEFIFRIKVEISRGHQNNWTVEQLIHLLDEMEGNRTAEQAISAALWLDRFCIYTF